MSEPASFVRDLAHGRAFGERPVRQWLSKGYRVREAATDEQRRGVDLVADGAFRLEVKLSRSARDAFFVETRGAQLGAGGWAFTTESDVLALVDATCRFVVLVRPHRLRA